MALSGLFNFMGKCAMDVSSCKQSVVSALGILGFVSPPKTKSVSRRVYFLRSCSKASMEVFDKDQDPGRSCKVSDTYPPVFFYLLFVPEALRVVDASLVFL